MRLAILSYLRYVHIAFVHTYSLRTYIQYSTWSSRSSSTSIGIPQPLYAVLYLSSTWRVCLPIPTLASYLPSYCTRLPVYLPSYLLYLLYLVLPRVPRITTSTVPSRESDGGRDTLPLHCLASELDPILSPTLPYLHQPFTSAATRDFTPTSQNNPTKNHRLSCAAP